MIMASASLQKILELFKCSTIRPKNLKKAKKADKTIFDNDLYAFSCLCISCA